MSRAMARSAVGGPGADISQLIASLEMLRRAGRGEASQDAARVIVEHWIRELAAISPRDTNRYIRGWIEAAHKVGIDVIPIPAVQGSKYAEFYERILQDQATAAYNEIVGLRYRQKVWFDDRGRRPNAWYYQAERRIQKTIERLRRANEQLAKYQGTEIAGSAIVFDARGQAWRSKTLGAGKKLATVRDKIYGGRGGWVQAPSGAWFIQLHNLEAHATIVEWRYKVVAAASHALKGSGLLSSTGVKFLAGLRKAGVVQVRAA